jgi:hypothetical protein
MAIANARPTIWSAKILRALNTLLVFGSPGVINRDYEGEVAEAGDTVKILTLGDVKISNYVKNTDMAAPEALTDAALTLTIDQQKAFNFGLDNIDRVQSNVDLMAEAARRAAYGLRKEADTFIGEKWKDIDTANKGSSYKWGTAEKIYEAIVEMGVLLDKTDTPDDGNRFVIVPPDAVGNLQRDIRFVGYGTQANRATLERGLPQGPNGIVGEAAGFKVYQSNQVPVESSKYKCIAGHPMGWSYVEQITKVVAYEPPYQFTDALKGLHVYGAKVVRPSQLAYFIAEA